MDRSALVAVRSLSNANTHSERGNRAGSAQRARALVTTSNVGSMIQFTANSGDDIVQAAVRNLNRLPFTSSTLPPTSPSAAGRPASPLVAKSWVPDSPMSPSDLISPSSSFALATSFQQTAPSGRPPLRATIAQTPPALAHHPSSVRRPASSRTPKPRTTVQRREEESIVPRLTEQLRRQMHEALVTTERHVSDATIPIDGSYDTTYSSIGIEAPSVEDINKNEQFSGTARLKRLHDRESHSLSWISYWARVDEMAVSSDLLLSHVQDNQRQIAYLAQERDSLKERLVSSLNTIQMLEKMVQDERQHGIDMLALETAKVNNIRSENERLINSIAELRGTTAVTEAAAARAHHENEVAQRALVKLKQEVEEERLNFAIEKLQLQRETTAKIKSMEEKEGRLEFLESDVLRLNARIKSLESSITLLTGEKDDLMGKLIASDNRAAEFGLGRKAVGADATTLQQMTQKAFQRRETELVDAAEKAKSRAVMRDAQIKRLRKVLRARCEMYETVALFAVDVDVHTGSRVHMPEAETTTTTTTTGGKTKKSKRVEPYVCGPLEAIAVEGKSKVESRLQMATQAQHMAPVIEAYQRIFFEMLPGVTSRFNEMISQAWEEIAQRIPGDPQGRPTGARETLHKYLQERCKGANKVLEECVAVHADTAVFIGNKEAKSLAAVKDEARAQSKADREAATLRESRLQSQINEERFKAQEAEQRSTSLENAVKALFAVGSSSIDSVVTTLQLPSLADYEVEVPERVDGPPEMNALVDMLARLAVAVRVFAEQQAEERAREVFGREATSVGDATSPGLHAFESRRSSIANRTPGAASLLSTNMSFGVDPLHQSERRNSRRVSVTMNTPTTAESPASERVLSGASRTLGTPSRGPVAVAPLAPDWSIDATSSIASPVTTSEPSALRSTKSSKSLQRNASLQKQSGSVADIVGVMRAAKQSPSAHPSSPLGNKLSPETSGSMSSEAVGKFVNALRDVTRSGRNKKSPQSNNAEVANLMLVGGGATV